MAVVDDLLVRNIGRLISSFIVALRSDGLHLPATTDLPAVKLDVQDLRVLELLARAPITTARIVERLGVEAGAVDALVEHLVARELIGPPEQRDDPEAVATVPHVERSLDLSAESDAPAVVATPLLFHLTARGYELVDHDGQVVVSLTAEELSTTVEMVRPVAQVAAFGAHRRRAGDHALDAERFTAVLRRLGDAGLLTLVDPQDPDHLDGQGHAARLFRLEMARTRELASVIGDSLAERDASRSPAAIEATRIIPVQHNGNLAPLALGMLFAYARAHDGGRLDDVYDFYPAWLTRKDHVQKNADRAAIYLFSNYHWSHAENLDVSEEVKRLSPQSLTIHGGPDTPKYEGDVEAYFRANPHVDIAVHGEGEATTAELLDALQGCLTGDRPDLSPLHDVAGLSFRDGDRTIHTPERDRITDLDTIPSPYLTGLFDAYGRASAPTAIIESNRGCPYGCTFCDWGSATLSRIRKFDLDRVLAELEWCATHGVPRIFMADANFGIFERDVQIAEKVAELKEKYGYPKSFVTNYAKNTVKHLRKIVEVMIGAGIFTEGLLSLQSLDTDTLTTIKRSNIKVEKYEQLAKEFRKAELPLYVDLMLGLPGATLTSFANDLQQCVDREVTAKVFLTELLVNSPMNDPEYKALHKIETAIDRHGMYGRKKSAAGTTNRALLVSTASYTNADYEAMKKLRINFLLCENYGVLRQLSRFVRQASGQREVDWYAQIRRDALDDRERWPYISILLETVPTIMVPPVSWQYFLDDVRRHVVEVVGVPDDSALDTAFRVQHALLPSRGRSFPFTTDLQHDYAAWHRAMIEAKDDGHLEDWTSIVPALSEFGPGSFTVEDAFEVCSRGIGNPMDHDGYGNWEMRSPISRSLPARHLV